MTPTPRKRHTPAQIAAKLRHAEDELAAGRSPRHVAEALGISEQTLYRWRKDYGPAGDTVALRIKRLEQDNHRLRRDLVTLERDKQALAEALRGNF